MGPGAFFRIVTEVAPIQYFFWARASEDALVSHAPQPKHTSNAGVVIFTLMTM